MQNIHTPSSKIIGVLGGCGPHAGLCLVKKIFEHTVAGVDQEHLPVYLSSVPERIPDRTEYLLDRNKENPGYAIADLIIQMESVGVDTVGIACNTSHADDIFHVIRESLLRKLSTVRLLNILDETVLALRDTYPDTRNVAVLSSYGTYKYRLYDDKLEAHGYNVIRPDNEFQWEYIHQSVYDQRFGLKARSSPVSKWVKTKLRKALDFFEKNNTEAIILGCTEFSLLADDPLFSGLQVIDSTTALARALIRETYPGKLTSPVRLAAAGQ
ncbi:MAG: amino acid racemase [Chitinophagaceae bacterium]